MADELDLQIAHMVKELSFPSSLISAGYSYKIQADAFGKTIFYEPDEERNFRAVISQED